MNKKLLFFPGLLYILVMTGCMAKNRKGIDPPKSSAGFAVVELFTSEGCSSCPPADEAVARLLSKKKANVYILSYHVDYWNRLGWKDPFSKAVFSKRQSEYGSYFNLESVYTPQIIVNGSTEFVGSDEDKLATVVDQGLTNEPLVNIDIDVKQNGDHVDIEYVVKGNDLNNQLLNFALLQEEATVSVKKGENGGRMLRHVNIVTEFKTINAESSGVVSIQTGEKISANAFRVIAFTQEKKNRHISGATQKRL